MDVTVAYSARIDEPEPDHRQRLWVTLQRTDQPVTYRYFCLKCGTQFPMAELVNVQPLVITDLMDTTNPKNAAIGMRCPGKYFDTDRGRLINCRTYYYWSLGATDGV